MRKFYRDLENRDPEVYLGIDETVIPIEMFIGVENIPTVVFGSDVYGIETQFYITKDGVIIVGMNKDEYVTKEDLKNEIWYIINSPILLSEL